MHQVLNVNVYCEDCLLSDKRDQNLDPFQMRINGSLFFNPETRTQSQGYKCPVCDKEITIVIEQPI